MTTPSDNLSDTFPDTPQRRLLCKTLLHGHQQLLDGLGRLWLWAFVFLVLQVEEEAQPVIRKIREDAAAAGDAKRVETLERFIAAAGLAR